MTHLSSAKPSLLDQVRHCLRLKHFSIRTEDAYVRVLRQFILYHKKRHPKEMGTDEIRQYLSHLAAMIYTHVLNRGGKGVRSPLDK